VSTYFLSLFNRNCFLHLGILTPTSLGYLLYETFRFFIFKLVPAFGVPDYFLPPLDPFNLNFKLNSPLLSCNSSAPTIEAIDMDGLPIKSSLHLIKSSISNQSVKKRVRVAFITIRQKLVLLSALQVKSGMWSYRGHNGTLGLFFVFFCIPKRTVNFNMERNCLVVVMLDLPSPIL